MTSLGRRLWTLDCGFRIRRARPILMIGACAFIAGCQSPGANQKAARAEATKRWNLTRADMKARLAGDELAAGRVPAAEAHLEEALQLSPDDSSLKLLEARVRLASGAQSEAEQSLAAAERLGGSTGEIEYLRGVIAQQRLEWADALRHFDRATKANPEDVASAAAAAQTRIQLGRADEALQRLEEARTRIGFKPAYHAACAECCEALGRWTEAADAWRLVAMSSNEADVRERYGVALLRAGRWAEAAATLRACIDEHKGRVDTELRLAVAEASLHLDDTAAAREELAFVLRERPDDRRALRLMALALAQAGENDRALAIAEPLARRSSGKDVTAAELAASIAWRAGQMTKAAEWARYIQRNSGEAENPVAKLILQDAR